MGLSIITTPQELWKFGTHERGSRGTPIVLKAAVAVGGGVASVSTFRALAAVAGYQVSAGKTLLITRLLGNGRQAAAGANFRYSDDDIGLNQNGPGTNPVYLDVTGDTLAGPVIFLTDSLLVSVDVYYEIPAGKYFSLESTTIGAPISLLAFGHEV